jgi:hypothetical protein
VLRDLGTLRYVALGDLEADRGGVELAGPDRAGDHRREAAVLQLPRREVDRHR